LSKRIASFALAFALAGCSANAGASSPFNPSAAVSPAALHASHADRGRKARVVLRVAIPRRHHRRERGRRPSWIGPDASSIVITGGAGIGTTTLDVATCPVSSGYAVCTVVVSWPEGLDGVTVAAYSGANGMGSALSDAQGAVQVALGGTNILNLALGGIPASVAVAQNLLLGAGVPKTATLAFTASDASGTPIAGTDPFDGGVAPTTTCANMAPETPACTLLFSAPNVGNTATVSYDGQSPVGLTNLGILPALSMLVNGSTYVGSSVFFLFNVVPVVDVGTTVAPATLTFAGPSAPSQSVTVSGMPVSSASLDACGSATVTLVGNVATVTPAADTTTACTLTLAGNAFDLTPYGGIPFVDLWQNAVNVPITIGASTVPVVDNLYGHAVPNAVRFASTSAPAQTMKFFPPPGYTGNVYISEAECWSTETTSSQTPWFVPAHGAAGNNSVALSSVASLSATSGASVNGSPVSITVSPSAAGVCELLVTNNPPTGLVFASGTKVFAMPVVAVSP
jgi:hypothetical protein